MKANRYYIVIILRVTLITLNSFVLVWFFSENHRPATTLFFLILLLLQTTSLILYLNRVNRDLANFLIHLQENDTSLVFSRNRVEKNFRNVMGELNEINKKIQDATVARETKHQYLQAVIEHLDIGILSTDSIGKADLVNKALMEIFGLKSFTGAENILEKHPELHHVFAEDFKEGVVKISSGGKIQELAVKAKNIRIAGDPIRIYSFQNIKQELETRELESWKKLIRVLRHEIMNSITPITTLTIAIKRCFMQNGTQKSVSEIDASNIEDALSSAAVIEERSKGLISFVEKFRNITDLPRPVYKSFLVAEMFGKVQLLFQNVMNEKDIKLTCISEPNLQLHGDEHLLEQVVINLLKNSVEAIGSHGKISLQAFFREDEKVCIRVTDSGPGILKDDLENIFVPSFSTKEHGMGLGLSISKQIVQMHNGEIIVNLEPCKTVFEILLDCQNANENSNNSPRF